MPELTVREPCDKRYQASHRLCDDFLLQGMYKTSFQYPNSTEKIQVEPYSSLFVLLKHWSLLMTISCKSVKESKYLIKFSIIIVLWFLNYGQKYVKTKDFDIFPVLDKNTKMRPKKLTMIILGISSISTFLYV